MNKSDSINDLAAALSKAQAEIECAAKDSANPFFKSSYADLASVWDACRGPLTKNGLSVVQLPSADGNVVKIESLLMHISGQFIAETLTMTAMDSKPQSIGSAITYARRYALASIAGVAPDDDDGNAASGRGRNEHERGKTTSKAPLNAPARATAPSDSSAPTKPAPPGSWRDVVIHFGKKKDTPLGKLDGESLSWWINNWQPKPYNGVIDGKDIDLRTALDLAKADIALNEPGEGSQPDPEENVDQEPITNWRDFVVTDLQFEGVLSKANGKKLGEIAEKGRAFIYEHFKPDISNVNHVRLKKALCLMHTETSSATAPH